jgi:hypothetical protein
VSAANETATVSQADVSGADGWCQPEPGARRVAPGLIGPRIHPAPTAEEAAAIVAAIEVLWPKPVVIVAAPQEGREAWRFSGRWWARPISARRPRPWY